MLILSKRGVQQEVFPFVFMVGGLSLISFFGNKDSLCGIPYSLARASSFNKR